MIPPKDLPNSFDDVENPHPLVAELADGSPGQPLAVRLRDLWTDLLRANDEASDLGSPARPFSAMPLLDYMKGIMQWD